MVFSSSVFLFYFFPLVLLGYLFFHKNLKAANIFLLLASLLFYAWGEPTFVFVMIASIVFNYAMALLIDYLGDKQAGRKLALAVTVAGNLSVLFLYKYLDFTITNLNLLTGTNIALANLTLPIGISFFTFQAMSYVIDVYRGDAAVQRKLQNVGLYVSLFPQLIAGPIVRYTTVAAEIEKREFNFALFSEGVHRFLIGLGKKMLFANQMALLADTAFSIPSDQRSILLAWLGAIGYSLQILFDFSGYSDMAIGLGKMFGFHFKENFDYPYIAKTISEFWRRWHISLGTWFRDYVYFPLGGSRTKSKVRLVFNLFVVWFLTGMWHGANWTFIVWGLMYFVLIAFEKATGITGSFKSKAVGAMYRIATLFAVLVGWIIFRADTLKDALVYIAQLFGAMGLVWNNYTPTLICDRFIMCLRERWVLMLFALLCCTPLFRNLRQKMKASSSNLVFTLSETGFVLFYVFVFAWCLSFIITGSHNPFIYFNF